MNYESNFKFPPPAIESHYNSTCISCSHPEDERETVAYTNLWKICVVPNQFLLGYCLIVARRHVGCLSDLTLEEWNELYKIIKTLEPALKNKLDADLINFECLRNNAYREKNPVPPFKNGKPNPHVHWHVMPRYSKSKNYFGRTFVDSNFGSPYQFKASLPDWELCDHLVYELRSAFK